ncbi:hypothetical protein B0T17DRAFT_399017 [Bombardia bombarda]|uniref:DNA/RNA-binding domain-containing protein n=1 Tax=Bombardia bombarda TaxID=252184 RepID=A0AA39WBU0_9PEZI|nr:hypothetical protein B0T17DRAFT_399017 [Bombardia bombarda]
MDLEMSWNGFLRRSSRLTGQDSKICTLCNQELDSGVDLAGYEKHISTIHSQALNEKASDEEKSNWVQSLWKAMLQSTTVESDGDKPAAATYEAHPRRTGKVAPAGESTKSSAAPLPSNRRKVAADPDSRQVSQGQQPQDPSAAAAVQKTPASSLKREGSRSRSHSPPRRSKAKPVSTPSKDETRADFDRGPLQKGRLWNPDDDSTRPRPHSYDQSNVATNHRLRVSSATHTKLPRQAQQARQAQQTQQVQQAQPAQATANRAPTFAVDDTARLIKQPETRPISQEQLVAEVKGIYAGLVMVENKCVEVDNSQNAHSAFTHKLNNEQWQALIALHRTLLHEHHDFFLASQHPSASSALRKLASKYAMPARMWRHGIHSFLELLRHRLPASLEHMLTFIYMAYSMMALLYETVPAFEDTWIECLGDLGRYRMAVEDDDPRDREVWTSVSRHWYSKASDKAPTTGRLYHHLAILARPAAAQQLFYYTKSLCVAIPFASARESIMTLFEPAMAQNASQKLRIQPNELAFVRAHGIMFCKKSQDKLESFMNEFVGSLDSHIGCTARRWIEFGYFIAISNCCALVGYGIENNPIFNAIKQARPDEAEDQDQDQAMTGSEIYQTTPGDIQNVLTLMNNTHNAVFRRFGDTNVLSYIHATLAFAYDMSFVPEAMAYVAPGFPWKLTALMLNTLLASYQSYSRIESENLPQPEKGDPPRPLPEDYAMRGLLWTDKHFPDDWFCIDKVGDEERYFEVASMTEERKERILHMGCRIAARNGEWLRYSSTTHQFSVGPQYDIDLGAVFSDLVISPSTEYEELPDATATF